MSTPMVIGLMLAASVIFVGYLVYTRQFAWLLGLLKNATLGVAGLLLGNVLLAPMGLAVGVNVLTAFIVGVLGLPGLLLLFAARWML